MVWSHTPLFPDMYEPIGCPCSISCKHVYLCICLSVCLSSSTVFQTHLGAWVERVGDTASRKRDLTPRRLVAVAYCVADNPQAVSSY